LKTVIDYAQLTAVSRSINAAQTKRTILNLERRLQFFVHTYLVHLIIFSYDCPHGHLKKKPPLIKIRSAAQNNRINLEAFAHPISQPPPDFKLELPDNLQWEVMSRPEGHTVTRGHQDAGTSSWARGEESVPLLDVRSERSVTIRTTLSILVILYYIIDLMTMQSQVQGLHILWFPRLVMNVRPGPCVKFEEYSYQFSALNANLSRAEQCYNACVIGGAEILWETVCSPLLYSYDRAFGRDPVT
jgi:hypothetical protein